MKPIPVMNAILHRQTSTNGADVIEPFLSRYAGSLFVICIKMSCGWKSHS